MSLCSGQPLLYFRIADQPRAICWPVPGRQALQFPREPCSHQLRTILLILLEFQIDRRKSRRRCLKRIENDQGPADNSLRSEEENGHADPVLYSTSCGAEEYVGE